MDLASRDLFEPVRVHVPALRRDKLLVPKLVPPGPGCKVQASGLVVEM